MLKIAPLRPALVALVLLAGSSTFAADAPPAGAAEAVVEACRDDVQTLCAGVQPGEGRIKACMRKNARKLSDGCKAALKDARAAKKAAGK